MVSAWPLGNVTSLPSLFHTTSPDELPHCNFRDWPAITVAFGAEDKMTGGPKKVTVIKYRVVILVH